ncbi:MAG: tRNA guanosine(34) transglycosylase Tgt [Acidimicrobiia bacterium]|nr:tRNA guanosine(34) transglycosylase Tgt [Acidimicrobiia bacterium]
MTHAASWESVASDGSARAGVLSLSHGDVETPTFMPVGTRAAVRGLDATDLANLGAQMVLSNTYHLMLRPGAEVVAELGGLHGFMGWNGPILTDSGGYQILSLDPKIDEDGATFRSTYDGSLVRLGPEESMRVQQLLGPDVAMVLDVLVGLPNTHEVVDAALTQTIRWSERALAAHTRADQALFGIVQGGVDVGLRKKSARMTAELGFSGFGIGGLAVGEEPWERNAALEATMPELPDHTPRYVMGLGDPEGVLDAVARGADLFDCVWPTRLARHGKILTAHGDYNLKRAEFARHGGPLAPDCPCHTCSTVSRGYLRHLLAANELTVFRLLSIHNLWFTLSMLRDARAAITEGRFADHHAAFVERRSKAG